MWGSWLLAPRGTDLSNSKVVRRLVARTVPKIVPATVDLHTCADVFRAYRRACRFRRKIVKLLNLGGKMW